MLLILMLTSKGMAGVPRASLVVIAATLNQFDIPEAGLLLILGVDTFLDMGRSATNAVGNSIATAVVAKWEGELLPEAEAAANAARMDEELKTSQARPRKPESRSKETVMASRTVWKPLLAFCAAGALLTGPPARRKATHRPCPTPRASRSRP